MTQQLINIGSAPNDGTGDTLRNAGSKINNNFTELYSRQGYTLPTASDVTLGGIKVGSGLSINPTGELSVSATYTLDNLSDVSIQNPIVNHVIKYNGSQWVNSTVPQSINKLDDLEDVELTTPIATEHILKYNGTLWVNTAPPALIDTLDKLTDVTITTPSNDQFLKYDGNSWINSALPSPLLQLNDLTDVTITTPSNDQILKYNGSQWINGTLPALINTLDDLTDVTITSPSNGQVLKYNGSQWVNGTDEGQSGNPFDQDLNTIDQVAFVSTTANQYNLSGSGTPTLESETDVYISAVGKVSIISKSPFNLGTMTTEERNALTNVSNGDIIYNASTNKFQGRAGGVWVDLH